MAKKSPKTKPVGGRAPAYPYTIVPNALRRFLKLMPSRPKPDKVTSSFLKTWGFNNGNDRSIISVLKALGILGEAGEPTENYEKCMFPATSGAYIVQQVRVIYSPLFKSSHRPDQMSDEELRRLFHVTSGGSDSVFQKQVATFRVLCEFCSFETASTSAISAQSTLGTAGGTTETTSAITPALPSMRIDLHIHLPENKTTREYQAIIEDIARFIYRQDIGNV